MTVPRLHVPSLLGRARADLLVLLLVAVVVALTTTVTSAVPPVADRVSDRAVAAAVRDAGTGGAVVLTAPVRDDSATPTRNPAAAAAVRQDVALARLELPRSLARVLRPPVGSIVSSELHVLGGGPGRYVRLAYVTGAGGTPEVTWVEGRAPAGSADGAVSVPEGSPPWPVQVGLSRSAATALGVRAGDRLRTEDDHAVPVDVRVSGVFEARTPRADVWRVAPQLLDPATSTSPSGGATAAALVGTPSLPDLRLAVPEDDLTGAVTFLPRPSALRWRRTSTLSRAVQQLKVTPSTTSSRSWDSRLDSVLQRAHDEAAAARAQAAVLVLGLLVVAALVLALAAQLVVKRRAGTLVTARERGAGLVGVAAELLVESVVVAGVGALLGLAVTRLVVGSASWTWPLPVVVVSVLATPVLGVLVAARAAAGRRVPANRTARRRLVRARSLRRSVVEVGVLVGALAATAALAQRGVVPPRGEDGVDLLAVSAPTWLLALGALVLLRGVPVLSRLALARTRRSPRGVAFFAAAGSVSEAARPLPFLVVAVSVAQLVVGLGLGATVEQGQSAGAWRAVGADARLQVEPSAAVGGLADRVRSRPGVRAAVAARVTDDVVVSSGPDSSVVRLVVVDAAAYARLLARTPFPAPQLRRLHGSSGREVPALLSGGSAGLRSGAGLSGTGERVQLDVVGRAPAVLTGSGPVVVVDAAAFRAAGQPVEPGTLWAVGPGAGRALARARAALGSADPVVRRTAVLAQRRDAPLVRALHALTTAASLLLLLLGALGVVLAAAVGAETRLTSLARLRTVGLDRRGARRVLAGVLVPPVVVAALVGLLLGVVCAAYVLGLLDLALLTGQAGGVRVVVPWWCPLLVLPAVASAVAVALLESATRGRASLGQLLRVGS